MVATTLKMPPAINTPPRILGNHFIGSLFACSNPTTAITGGHTSKGTYGSSGGRWCIAWFGGLLSFAERMYDRRMAFIFV